MAEASSVRPGHPIEVAVLFDVERGWHVYWRNPGDAGLGPSITWALPPGWSAGEIQWPYPERISTPGVTTYGYRDDFMLLVELTPPDALEIGATITLRADVDWLACDEACVAGNAKVGLALPVAAEVPACDEHWAERFAEARARLPIEPPGWRVRARADSDHVVLELTPPDGFDTALDGVQFFPYDGHLIDHGAKQVLSATDDGFRLSIRRARSGRDIPARVVGILVSPNGWGDDSSAAAIEVDVPFEEVPLSRKESERAL
ncbi:MAG: hypothetical protein JW889_08215 [Verrucomicrobia bacterium]|nr:hypothetical protein [Verrucomicrobiota bacterium]